MVQELYANDFITTLAGSISASATNFLINDALPSALQQTGQFRLLIESEIVIVDSYDGFNIFVQRGMEGTTAVAHAGGVQAAHILTAGSLENLTPNNSPLSGTFASMPAAGVAGRLYFTTDTCFTYLDNGIKWLPFCRGQFIDSTYTPQVANFTQQNFSSAVTAVGTYNGIYMQSTNASGLAMLEQTWTPGKTLLCFGCITGQAKENGGWIMGFSFRAPSSTSSIMSLVIIRAGGDSGVLQAGCTTQNNATSSFSASSLLSSNSVPLAGEYVWYKIHDDGTNLNFSISRDGLTFDLLVSVSNTNFLGVSPTAVGLAMGWGTTNTLAFHCMYWKVS